MSKCLVNFITATCLFLLAGCQASTLGSVSPFFGSNPEPSLSLAQVVQEALSNSDDAQLAQVHVEQNNNTIILSGYVKKIRQSDTAEQIAHQVSGVTMVQNNIIIRP